MLFSFQPYKINNTEKFTKKIQIKARTLGDIAINHIVPTAIIYMTTLIDNVKGLKEIFDDKEVANFKEIVIRVQMRKQIFPKIINALFIFHS